MGTISLELDALHEGQLKVVSEARRWNVLQCGRRFGKTCLGENRVIETALNGQPAAWFAPTYKLLADVWRHLVWSLKSVTASVNQQEKQLRLITGGIIDCWSLDQPDAGRGRKYKRVVVDEAGIVRLLQESWQEAIRPTLTDLKGDAWLLGTPKGRNFFHRLYARGE
jgi:phage terminase large subunit-like protein